MMRKTLESREIVFYCDFHGHSRAMNSFMYGCSNNQVKEKRFKERVFPLMFSKRCEDFNFEGCSFNLQKSKESTARVVLWKEYQLINSFTLECSFCGPSKGMHADTHFTIQMLLNLGRNFCRTLVEYSEMERTQDGQRIMRKMIKDIEIACKNTVG